MREIKFRAWDKDYMIYDTWKPSDDTHWDWDTIPNLVYKVNDMLKCGYIWMQFTGLLDKNGKEIYEGDIIRGYKINAVVTFTDGGFWFVDNANCDGGYRTEQEVREVVGNIYENPELLTRKEQK